MVYKILIDIEAIFGLPQLHPCRFDVCRAVTLLQKEDIQRFFCESVARSSSNT